jgi:hypothetical protein
MTAKLPPTIGDSAAVIFVLSECCQLTDPGDHVGIRRVAVTDLMDQFRDTSHKGVALIVIFQVVSLGRLRVVFID